MYPFPDFDADEGDKKRQRPSWQVTFLDLVLLMITFFVMSLAMSTYQEEDFHELVVSLQQQVDQYVPSRDQDVRENPKINAVHDTQGMHLDYLQDILKSHFNESDSLKDTEITRIADKIVISLPSALVFDAGETEVSAKVRTALFQFAQILSNVANSLEVIGYAGQENYDPDRFSSYWALSLTRAQQVADILKKAGYTDNIVVSGNGDGHVKALSALPNELQEKLARRVDIIVLPGVKR
jgi:chemotaxis protein MotB